MGSSRKKAVLDSTQRGQRGGLGAGAGAGANVVFLKEGEAGLAVEVTDDVAIG